MIFFEFFAHLFALDIPWIIELIFSNLLWVFGIGALVFFFWEGKHFIQAFIGFCLGVWAWYALGVTAGLAIFGALFLMLNYITKITVIKVAEETPALKDKLVIVSTVSFYVLLILYKVFIG